MHIPAVLFVHLLWDELVRAIVALFHTLVRATVRRSEQPMENI